MVTSHRKGRARKNTHARQSQIASATLSKSTISPMTMKRINICENSKSAQNWCTRGFVVVRKSGLLEPRDGFRSTKANRVRVFSYNSPLNEFCASHIYVVKGVLGKQVYTSMEIVRSSFPYFYPLSSFMNCADPTIFIEINTETRASYHLSIHFYSLNISKLVVS